MRLSTKELNVGPLLVYRGNEYYVSINLKLIKDDWSFCHINVVRSGSIPATDKAEQAIKTEVLKSWKEFAAQDKVKILLLEAGFEKLVGQQVAAEESLAEARKAVVERIADLERIQSETLAFKIKLNKAKLAAGSTSE